MDGFDTLKIKEIVYIDSNITEGNGCCSSSNCSSTRKLQSFNFSLTFDKSKLEASRRVVTVDLAKEIRNKPGAKIVITGNADKKGSEEYNMLLGQRRAGTTADVLIKDYGVDPKQIVSVISKGKNQTLYPSQEPMLIDVLILS